MKYKGSKQAIFQSFLFNIIFIIIFSVAGVYYVLPLLTEVSENKVKLEKLGDTYFKLKKEGLSYKNFTELHKTLGKEKGLDKNIYLSNILQDFGKQDYEQYFKNTNDTNYNEFLDAQIKDARIKKQELDETGINNSVKDILPYYTDDASLSEESFTDFRFINRIESLLDSFRLSTKDSIGMGDLEIVNSIERKSGKSKGGGSPMDGRIYSGVLKLSLVGKKKNIINFIHYLDNVGKIEIDDGDVSIKKPSTLLTTMEDGIEKQNDFTDIGKYFIGEDDIYNGLLMEVDRLDIKEYLDSSDLPTPDGFTFLKLAKDSQGDERYNADISIRFYVKGLPSYKIRTFVKNISQRYAQLLQVAKVGIQYITKNKETLRGSNSLSAINSLGKINRYLNSIESDIGVMKKGLGSKGDIGEAYKSAQEYNRVFQIVSKRLDGDLKSISIALYKKYRDILSNK